MSIMGIGQTCLLGTDEDHLYRPDELCSMIFMKLFPYFPSLKLEEIEGLRAIELVLLSGFLTKNILGRKECSIDRPAYSVSSNQLPIEDYTRNMIEHISGYGHIFISDHHTYMPAFLEALANYCEHQHRT